jgi:hypothetical protein
VVMLFSFGYFSFHFCFNMPAFLSNGNIYYMWRCKTSYISEAIAPELIVSKKYRRSHVFPSLPLTAVYVRERAKNWVFLRREKRGRP